MGRWAIFFVAIFVICSYFSAQVEYDTTTGYYGEDALGATALTTALTTSTAPAQTLHVTSTTDFQGPTGHIKVGNEIIYYTTKDATHFLGCTRGVADPKVTNTPEATKVVAHAIGDKVYTLATAALNASLGINIVNAEGSTGEINAANFLWTFFWHLPKYVAWNFPFLENEAGGMLKLFILYPLSAGFIITVCASLLQLAQGLFKL